MKDDSSAVAKFGIGQPMRRIEDLRFITGAARYVDDRREPGMLHAAFLRSPHAHATLGATGAPPAVIHAVLDAISDWGIKTLDMPLTPQKLWQAINGEDRG